MEILDRFNIKPNNYNLFVEAFTHTSYSNEHIGCASYERLEFLGDAVLELIISDYLYNERQYEEGTMTKMRSSYVCEAACATYAKELGFNKIIRLGSGEDTPNDTILADVFESFIAAIYLDQGYNFVSKIVLDIITSYIEKGIDFLHDYKSELQELVQNLKKTVTYEVIDEIGPAHDKTFTSQALIDGLVVGTGTGSSKKNAEQEAAKEALSKYIS